jgi:hypothetical protein
LPLKNQRDLVQNGVEENGISHNVIIDVELSVIHGGKNK